MAARLQSVPRASAHQAAHAASPFNSRGVVEEPDFTLARPAADRQIQLAARAHPVEGGWIAEAAWQSACGHLPGDGSYPHTRSRVFPSRSEAVEDALNRALRQITSQLGEAAQSRPWLALVESARAWVAEAVHQVRSQDESLPLRGLTAADLFAGGLGGFGLALTGLGARMALACEIDPEARAVYMDNVRPAKVCGDICELDATALRVDILTVGLLCQAFSNSGKRRGFADPKLATAYAALLRVLREAEAKVVIIECARGLLTQDGGQDAERLRHVLRLAGFRVQHRTLNAAGFGVPQSRERSFIVGTRLGIAVDDVLGYLFPKQSAPSAVVADILDKHLPATVSEAEIVPHRPARGCGTGAPRLVGHIAGKRSQGYRVYCPASSVGSTVTASGGGRAQFGGAYRVPGGARGLSPREAARMQGLPEWAVLHDSHRHAMRHAGNAVAVPLARELMRALGGVLRPQDTGRAER